MFPFIKFHLMCPVRVNSLNCQKELPGADLLDGFILSQTLVLEC